MFNPTPESMKQQAATQVRASLAFQKRVLDWQMEQARLAEKQMTVALGAQRAMAEDALSALNAAQVAMVDAMFPVVEQKA